MVFGLSLLHNLPTDGLINQKNGKSAIIFANLFAIDYVIDWCNKPVFKNSPNSTIELWSFNIKMFGCLHWFATWLVYPEETVAYIAFNAFYKLYCYKQIEESKDAKVDKEQTDEIKNLAVQQNGDALEYVKEQTDVEICNLAVEQKDIKNID